MALILLIANNNYKIKFCLPLSISQYTKPLYMWSFLILVFIIAV